VFGHFTVFITRTKDHFWSSKPAFALLAAVILTQITATLITVYGFLLPAMGWKLAGFIWISGIVVFIITDFLKVYLYRLLDHTNLKFKR
jgi:H+-transporting ATPase